MSTVAPPPSPTWPPDAARRYRERGLWTGETFDGFLRERARRHGGRAALRGADGETLTYAELEARAGALAAALAGSGLRAGERVVVQLPNVPGYVALLFGLWRIGALPVFALPAHRRSELEAIAAAAEASAIVTGGSVAGFDHDALGAEVAAAVPSLRAALRVAELERLGAGAEAPEPSPRPAGEVAFLQLSGGTTGTPKLIPRTADDYLYSVRASAEICALDERTAYLCALPAAHNFPLSSPGILGVLDRGGRVVMAPSGEPGSCFATIERERVTMTALVPPLLLAWLDAAPTAGADLGTLELVQVGGAKLAPEAARRVGPVLGARLQQVFGMAEGLVCYTRSEDPEEIVLTTQGRPISDADEIRVVTPDGDPVAAGEAGLLETRGPYTIRGYYRDADPGSFSPDGFYRTGDVVRRLASGHLVVEGRAKDQINRGGEKIAPDEVEDQILAHPGVHDAVLLALPDERLGERTCAVLLASGEPPSGAELRRFLRERGLAAFKIPDRVRVVDAFPRTGVGKVSRRELRERLAELLAAEGSR